MNEYIIGLVIIGFIIIAIVTWAFWGLSSKAQEFFKEADILEQKVKTQDNKDEQIKEFIQLHKKSFHRNTGNRIKEIAKLMEFKYDIKILR